MHSLDVKHLFYGDGQSALNTGNMYCIYFQLTFYDNHEIFLDTESPKSPCESRQPGPSPLSHVRKGPPPTRPTGQHGTTLPNEDKSLPQIKVTTKGHKHYTKPHRLYGCKSCKHGKHGKKGSSQVRSLTNFPLFQLFLVNC